MKDPMKLTLEEAVRAFLDVAMLHPEKPPKTQRAERENQMMIVGYNRAQEDLRTVLEQHGKTARIRSIAEVRNEQQQQPMKIGNTKVWAA